MFRPAPVIGISASSVTAFVYAASPTQQGQSGVRGFGGDSSGIVCYSSDGQTVTYALGALVPGPGCITLK